MTVQGIYSIPVETKPGYSVTYSYSATDTVHDLKKKIFNNEGVPLDLQRLYVQYGWRNLWKRVDISDKTTELLVNHLQTASKINVYVRLNSPS